MPKDRAVKTGIYAVFFLSGAAGLIYQIVWTRMLILTFGSTTHSVVAVLSAFMAGLALGSWGIGKIKKETIPHLRLYAFLELIIGISGLMSPYLFGALTYIYSALYGYLPDIFILPLKFVLTFIVLLLPTTAMGATLPVIIEFIKTRFSGLIGEETSRLYAINTFGACAGVLTAGFFLLELMGLRATVMVAASINITLALLMGILSNMHFRIKPDTDIGPGGEVRAYLYPKDKLILALSVFAVSGVLGMSYEIAWTRLLTPTTGTFIYAFSSMLAVLLFGIALGSLIYPAVSRSKWPPLLLFGMIELAIGLGGIASLFATSHLTNLSQQLTVLFTILPASLGMGMTFPVVASLLPDKESVSGFIGKSYALNTLGSMAGPIVAGFVFLPVFGTVRTIIFLALVNFLFGTILFGVESANKLQRHRKAGLAICAVGIIIALYLGSVRTDLVEERTKHTLLTKFSKGAYAWKDIEDETADVVGYNNRTGDYGLLVDGMGMSVLVDETKLMAHLPLMLHPDPKDTLVICFGMGTTFRSALTYGGNVDAIELVPSVPKMFPIYYTDAQEVLANPKGHIIINDGRNYVRMTGKKYDVITVDPPPPVNAAGTTVLYSKEFYEDSKKILKPGGLFTEWFFYGTRSDDFQYLLRSFTDAFPYVAVFSSPRAIGIYLIGSEQPVKPDPKLIAARFANTKVRADLNEWGYWDEKNLPSLYIGDKSVLLPFIDAAPPVTDDRPRTEYFLLRHRQQGLGIARNEVLFPER